MRVGITGHRRIPGNDTWQWVTREMRRLLAGLEPPLVGVTSLAIGADQLFSEIVLSLGGTIEIVLPFEDYERTFDNDMDLDKFCRLREAASRTEILETGGGDEEAYLHAGQRIVCLSRLLVAVWDGLPAQGMGGTADIVKFARSAGVPVVHMNPKSKEITRV